MTGIGWHHSSLSVRDLDRSASFFATMFGFEDLFVARGMTGEIRGVTGGRARGADLRQMRMSGSGHVLELIAFDWPGGAEDGADAPVRVGHGHVAFTVPDLDAALARALAAGAAQVGEITGFEEGRAVYLQEPGGAIVELEEIVDAS